MIRELLLDEVSGFTRAAIIEDGRLCEIHTERLAASAQAESLYYGKVVSIRAAIQAAFVDIGDELNAFLPLDDSLKLKCGDMIIVQGMARQATETKGLRITAKINLAGKWIVLIPQSQGLHISKKIKDESLRKMLLEIGGRICPAGFGMIIRTASAEITEKQLREEADALAEKWIQIERKALGMTRPGLLHQREPLWKRMARDIRNVSRIVTNNTEVYASLRLIQKENQIDTGVVIERHDESVQLLFDAFGVETQIDKALKQRVWLPCGGYLIMDFCEAMTVIDVNSGKMILGRSIEDTALQVNLEAADEIARQIRLRDVGGIIIVDFIDMQDASHRDIILHRIKSAVANDRTQVNVEGFTRLGLMEMTRKRVHDSLGKSMKTSCSYCSSTGSILKGEEVALRAIRQVRRMMIAGQRGPFIIRCAAAAAQAFKDMNSSFDKADVYISAVQGKHAERFDIEQLGEGVAIPGGAFLLR